MSNLISGFLITKAIEKILGKTAKGIFLVYKIHFKLVAYMISESKNGDIKQIRVNEIQKNLEKLISYGKDLNYYIPNNPKIILKNKLTIDSIVMNNPKSYDLKVKLFADDCSRVIQYFDEFIKKSESIINECSKQIKEIEENLYNYEKSKVPIFRFIIDKNIENQLELLKLEGWGEISELKQIVNQSKKIQNAYKRVISIN